MRNVYLFMVPNCYKINSRSSNSNKLNISYMMFVCAFEIYYVEEKNKKLVPSSFTLDELTL